ncbi:MAG: copper chaperone PCu(A)C [Gammaproteobacteria bacterium]
MRGFALIAMAVRKCLDFAPGGYHLMRFDRKHPLHIGRQIPVTLKFSNAAHCTVEFVVRGASGE